MNDYETKPRVVITGMGLITPIGCEPELILKNLRAGKSAIGKITSMDLDLTVAEVKDFDEDIDQVDEDRATRMAKAAAFRALSQAERAGGLDRSRLAIAFGASGSGQFQNMRFTIDRGQAVGPEVARYHDRNVPHFPAKRLAQAIGSVGPRASVCSASTGSAVAIGVAMRWLTSGKVEAALVGGAEVLTLLTLLGMGSLGIMADGPTAPFSGREGITFGEGAAIFVLETEEAAKRRGAEILAELLGFGASNDGYDPIANDPSGHGLARAVRWALRDAALPASAVDWIRASGTGHREQDLAETLGTKEVFQEEQDTALQVPPISTIEPLIGHANGASPALGVGFAALCLKEGLIPATHHFTVPRPGCDLDYVPNAPRDTKIETVLCNCMAFGGSNAAILVGAAGVRSRKPARKPDYVVITGAGIVSPVGHSLHALSSALFGASSRQCDSNHADGFDWDGPARRVLAWNPRAELPAIDLRRADRLSQFAIVAASKALTSAGLVRNVFNPDRVGVMTGLSRGPAAASERFFDEVLRASFAPALGRFMLRMGRFSVASAVSHALKLLGPTATFSEGTSAGLHVLCHAVEALREDDQLDAIVVVAADELSPLGLRLDADAGRVTRDSEGMKLYCTDSTGSIASEGAVAVVLEREKKAHDRGAKAMGRIAGYGLSGASNPTETAQAIARAGLEALAEAGVGVDDLDLCVGSGRGRPGYDLAERDGLTLALADRAHRCAATATATAVGVSESASGLFSVLAALLAVASSQAPALSAQPPLDQSVLDWVGPVHRPGRYRKILIAGGSDEGNCAAVIVEASNGILE